MKTRERIIETAITLFNERSTAAVSTNHIAAACGVSPGVLYHHFRNKEEIIRAIFAHMRVVWVAASALPDDRAPTLAHVSEIVGRNFAVLWEYRFYYRELLALIGRDPAFGAEYRAARGQFLVNIEALLRRFVAAGVLREPEEPETLPQLATACLLIVDFWLPFAELGPEPVGATQMRQGVELVLAVLRPHLTEAARAGLAAGIGAGSVV